MHGLNKVQTRPLTFTVLEPVWWVNPGSACLYSTPNSPHIVIPFGACHFTDRWILRTAHSCDSVFRRGVHMEARAVALPSIGSTNLAMHCLGAGSRKVPGSDAGGNLWMNMFARNIRKFMGTQRRSHDGDILLAALQAGDNARAHARGHRWNRHPQPQPQTFTRFVFPI